MRPPATDARAARPSVPTGGRGASGLVTYLLLGAWFGLVITKAQVVSWFRIQEMFRFQSFHMYGVIVTAVVTAGVLMAVVRRSGVRSAYGDAIHVPPKTMGKGVRYIAGGTVFGLGWSLTGACPGPLAALVGSGVTVMAVAILSATAGTWVYGRLRPRLPH